MNESETIREFLTMRGGALCDDCLGRRLRLPEDDVKAAIFAGSRYFTRAYGQCGACRQPRAVTRRRVAA